MNTCETVVRAWMHRVKGARMHRLQVSISEQSRSSRLSHAIHADESILRVFIATARSLELIVNLDIQFTRVVCRFTTVELSSDGVA